MMLKRVRKAEIMGRHAQKRQTEFCVQQVTKRYQHNRGYKNSFFSPEDITTPYSDSILAHSILHSLPFGESISAVKLILRRHESEKEVRKVCFQLIIARLVQ